MKRATIFGGSGFIGSHLANALLKEGISVTIADLLPPDHSLPVKFVECDVRKTVPSDLSEIPDRVYNLAAIHRVPGHLDSEYFETNVPGAQNVTNYCRELNVSRLCFTSSIAVYGPSEQPVDELSALSPNTAYGKSKLLAEEIHRAWVHEAAGRHLAIVRPGVIFGRNEKGNFTRLARALERRTFFYAGRKDTIKACGYVEELIRSILFMESLNERHLTYNFCYPNAYTIEDICNAMADTCGLHKPIGMVPIELLHGIAWIFELASRMGLKNGITRSRVDKLAKSTHILPTALLQNGYAFTTDLHQGLRMWKEQGAGSLS